MGLCVGIRFGIYMGGFMGLCLDEIYMYMGAFNELSVGMREVYMGGFMGLCWDEIYIYIYVNI